MIHTVYLKYVEFISTIADIFFIYVWDSSIYKYMHNKFKFIRFLRESRVNPNRYAIKIYER